MESIYKYPIIEDGFVCQAGFFCAGVVISDQFESGGLEDILHALQLGL